MFFAELLDTILLLVYGGRMELMTKRERACYDAVIGLIESNGYSPRCHEVAGRIGVSESRAYRLMQQLIVKGWIVSKTRAHYQPIQ